MSIFTAIGQAASAYLWRSVGKNWAPLLASRLSVSGSLKVIGTDTDRSSTHDFLLTFFVYRPVLYHFQDIARSLGRKLQTFICELKDPADRVPFGIVLGLNRLINGTNECVGQTSADCKYCAYAQHRAVRTSLWIYR